MSQSNYVSHCGNVLLWIDFHCMDKKKKKKQYLFFIFSISFSIKPYYPFKIKFVFKGGAVKLMVIFLFNLFSVYQSNLEMSSDARNWEVKKHTPPFKHCQLFMWQTKLRAAVQTKDLSGLRNITAIVIQRKQSITVTIVSSLEVL